MCVWVILKLTAWDNISTAETTRMFYTKNNFDLQEKAMFTFPSFASITYAPSEGAQLMLAKDDVTAIVRREIQHATATTRCPQGRPAIRRRIGKHGSLAAGSGTVTNNIKQSLYRPGRAQTVPG